MVHNKTSIQQRQIENKNQMFKTQKSGNNISKLQRVRGEWVREGEENKLKQMCVRFKSLCVVIDRHT